MDIHFFMKENKLKHEENTHQKNRLIHYAKESASNKRTWQLSHTLFSHTTGEPNKCDIKPKLTKYKKLRRSKKIKSMRRHAKAHLFSLRRLGLAPNIRL